LDDCGVHPASPAVRRSPLETRRGGALPFALP
jgi:hypothetical protein